MLDRGKLDCGSVTLTYFQGFYNTQAFWSVVCSSGQDWSIRLPKRQSEKIAIKNCIHFEFEGIGCFDEFDSKTNFLIKGNSTVKDDSGSRCENAPHTSVSDGGIVTDRCGLVSVKLDKLFVDDTNNYLSEQKKFSPSKDPGIISLLRLRADSYTPSCKIRQLRYFPNEVGYRFTNQRLAEEVANTYIYTMMNLVEDISISDMLNKGIAMPATGRSPTPDKSKLISSKSIDINGVDAWQTIYELWSSKAESSFDSAHKQWTVVFSLPRSYYRNDNKYFIVTECGHTNARLNLSKKDGFINRLIRNIKLAKN